MYEYSPQQQQALYNLAMGGPQMQAPSYTQYGGGQGFSGYGLPLSGPSFLGGGSAAYNQQPSAQTSGYPQGAAGSPWGQAGSQLASPGGFGWLQQGMPQKKQGGHMAQDPVWGPGAPQQQSQGGWSGTPGEMPSPPPLGQGGSVAGGGSTGGSHPRPFM
jgi:hypothetical protein